MNILLSAKNETLETLRLCEEKIKKLESSIETLKSLVNEENEKKDYLLNPDNSPLLLYFFTEKDLNFIEPNAMYNHYLYDYKTGQVIINTNINPNLPDYPSIDITNIFKEDTVTDNFDNVKETINKFVDYLINEYNPKSWNELKTLIYISLINKDYELAINESKLVKTE